MVPRSAACVVIQSSCLGYKVLDSASAEHRGAFCYLRAAIAELSDRLNATMSLKLVSVIAVLLVSAAGCANPDEKPMQALLDRLSHGGEAELPSMLFGYQQSSPGAREVLLGMLKVLRPPSPDQHMKFEASRRAGRFTMIVAKVPWHKGPHAYEHQPIILCREGDQYQVVGYVLPFNDIFQLIQSADGESINELTQWYVQTYGMRAADGG